MPRHVINNIYISSDFCPTKQYCLELRIIQSQYFKIKVNISEEFRVDEDYTTNFELKLWLTQLTLKKEIKDKSKTKQKLKKDVIINEIPIYKCWREGNLFK